MPKKSAPSASKNRLAVAKTSVKAKPPLLDLGHTRIHLSAVASWARRSSLARFALLWAVAFAILLSAMFSRFLHDYNFIETFPGELWFPIVLHSLSALLAATIVSLARQPSLLAAKLVSVSVLAMLFIGYEDRLRNFTYFMRTWIPLLPAPDRDKPILALVLLIAVSLAALAVGYACQRWVQRSPHIHAKNIALAILLMVGSLFATQTIPSLRILSLTTPQSRVSAPALPKPAQPLPTAQTATDLPDIYYIVLDRYPNATILRDQFAFDNTPFTGFLRQNNFTVNNTAFANYPFTSISISSTLSATYTKPYIQPFIEQPAQSHTLYHNLIYQSNVVKALQEKGYRYHMVGSTYGATYKAPLAVDDAMYSNKLTVFGKSKRLRGLQITEFMQSPFYWLSKLPPQWTAWPISLLEVDSVGFVKGQLAKLQNLASSPDQGGRLIMAHILVPHDPFSFNADGSISPYMESDNFGKPIKQKFTGQVEFINSQMQKLVTTIQQHSNNQAVILFNADEGPYPNIMNQVLSGYDFKDVMDYDMGALKGNMTKWPTDWLQMKFAVLQAVHIPRATDDDLAHLSSVNLFRIVLNRYAGYELEYLPECYFALTKGTHAEFKYTSVNNLLGIENSDYCTSMQTTL